jgi:hypothetical protein
MVLRRILGPSPEMGAIFDAALLGIIARLQFAVCEAVQEQCDEKGGS